jgi:hypothetical protein
LGEEATSTAAVVITPLDEVLVFAEALVLDEVLVLVGAAAFAEA